MASFALLSEHRQTAGTGRTEAWLSSPVHSLDKHPKFHFIGRTKS